ncbi:MAG TPA: hypothetical protein VE999_14580 [Gemmataceae bacterium]|nr:hypothetical protein [Gemmataceae bacterium]
MPQQANLNDIIPLLEEATRKGSVKWIPEEEDSDSFNAAFDAGTVRISRIIVGSIYLLEMLDPQGRTIAVVESSSQLARNNDDVVTYNLLERLHRCARNQALSADDRIGALLAEIRRRASQEAGVKN